MFPNLGVGTPLGSLDMHVGSQEVADMLYGYFGTNGLEPFCWGLSPPEGSGFEPHRGGAFSLLIKMSLQITRRIRLKRLLRGIKVSKICPHNFQCFLI